MQIVVTCESNCTRIIYQRIYGVLVENFGFQVVQLMPHISGHIVVDWLVHCPSLSNVCDPFVLFRLARRMQHRYIHGLTGHLYHSIKMDVEFDLKTSAPMLTEGPDSRKQWSGV